MIPKRVIKLGGSCLDNPQLAIAIHHWLLTLTPGQNLWIVGGGQAIDAMRQLAALHPLDEANMHWRCVNLLRASFEIVAELLPTWSVISERQAWQQLLAELPQTENYLLAVDSFYSRQSSQDSRLPEGWATTTDAIAAYLARLSNADELILLKSCEVTEIDPLQLAQQGIVDLAFPAAMPAATKLQLVTLPRVTGST